MQHILSGDYRERLASPKYAGAITGVSDTHENHVLLLQGRSPTQWQFSAVPRRHEDEQSIAFIRRGTWHVKYEVFFCEIDRLVWHLSRSGRRSSHEGAHQSRRELRFPRGRWVFAKLDHAFFSSNPRG